MHCPSQLCQFKRVSRKRVELLLQGSQSSPASSPAVRSSALCIPTKAFMLSPYRAE
ncbi:hypothetical protein Q9966_004100 [Columba livia]|nr:hypothetical protein Q9966_004100 [Columba livia]